MICIAGAQESIDKALDRIVSRCSSPSEIASALTRKMDITKMSMNPKTVQELYQAMQEDEAKVLNMFEGADVDELRSFIQVTSIAYMTHDEHGSFLEGQLVSISHRQ